METLGEVAGWVSPVRPPSQEQVAQYGVPIRRFRKSFRKSSRLFSKSELENHLMSVYAEVGRSGFDINRAMDMLEDPASGQVWFEQDV